MYICNIFIATYFCIAATVSLMKYSASAQTEPIIKLSDCECSHTSQCNDVPKQTAPMILRCDPFICCLTDDITRHPLPHLPISTQSEIVDVHGGGAGINECLCLFHFACRDLGGTVDSSVNAPVCLGGNEVVCCILKRTDVEPVDENLSTMDHIHTDIEDTSECICVPNGQCAQDTYLVINLRTSSASNICKDALEVCCHADDVIIEEPVITFKDTSSCECVPDYRCATDLSLVVNIRTSVSTNICDNPSLVCCDMNDIIEQTPSIDVNATTEKCICVEHEYCLEILDLFAIVDVRRKSGSTDCEDRLKTCCPVSQIVNGTSLIRELPVDIESRECTCVQPKYCNPFSDISVIVDVRRKTKACDEPSAICCFPEDISLRTGESTPTCNCIPESLCSDSIIMFRDEAVGASCVAPEICCDNPKEVEHTLSCGESHKTNPRINVTMSLGSQAIFAEFPWMVSIFEVDSSGKEIYKCGGSLIHPSIVLTTAHCIAQVHENILKVRAGELDIESTVEERPHVEQYVTSRIMHPSFSPRRLNFNTGLLYLDKSIRLQYHINTICLPQSKDFKDYEQSCIATGWGKTEFGDREKFQSTLKKINLPLVDSVKCENALRKTRLGPRFRLDPTVICAGGSSEDTCTGDGGSPLICKITDGSNKYLQVGAVAWGIECGNVNIPGVYASLFATVEWIKETVIRDFGKHALNYFTYI